MGAVVDLDPRPEPAATAAWQRVADALERAACMLGDVPSMILSGSRTCAELNQAADLIDQAHAILARLEAHWGPRYARSRAANTV